MQSSEWINLKTMNFIDRFVWTELTFGQITVTTTTREKNTISHQTFPMAEKCAVARLYVTLHCRSVNLILTYIYIYTLFSVKFIYGCCGCSCCRRRRRRYCYFYDRCSHKCTCICAPVCVCVCVYVNRYKNLFWLEIRLRILCFFTPISRVKFIYSFTLIIYDEERNKLFDIFEFTLDFLNLSSALMILWHFSCDSAPHLHCWCTWTNQNTHS